MEQESQTSDALLRLDRVSKSFGMGEVTVEVLKELTLDIDHKEFLAIVGPSGSGKTTLLNLIGGLDTPTEGTIYYEGQRLSDFSSSQLTAFRRTEIGFVFQLYNLVPNLTAHENIAVATELCDDPIPIDKVLSLVGLASRASHFPSQLSGGEQQRVAIARAVAKKPKLLLCDEPTGALDFKTGRQVLHELRELSRKLETTVVIITHNAALAQVADRTVHLSSGGVAHIESNPNPIDPLEVTW